MSILTPRQEQIAQAIALGATKKEIAYQLEISEETVSNHAKVIYEKTGARSVGQLSVWWFRKTYKIMAELDPFTTVLGLFFLFLSAANEFDVDDDSTMRTTRTARAGRVRKGNRKNDKNTASI